MDSISFLSVISFIGYTVEVVGVVIILLGMGSATLRYAKRYLSTLETDLYHSFRREMGRAMLVGLEFLVAGDIIRTVSTCGYTIEFATGVRAWGGGLAGIALAGTLGSAIPAWQASRVDVVRAIRRGE